MIAFAEPGETSGEHQQQRKWLRALQFFGKLFFAIWAWGSVAIFALWSVIALYFLDYLPRPICVLLSLAFAVGCIVILAKSSNRRQALACIAGGIIVTWLLWSFVTPRHERQWAKDQAKLASVEIDTEGHVHLENFRHATYRSVDDFDVDYRTIDFEIERIESVWYVVQRFSVVDGLAHTFVSFGLSDSIGATSDPATSDGNDQDDVRHIAVSVEIRREPEEAFSPLLGIFRRYEVNYIMGDERDLIGVRTNVRDADEIYLYRTNASAEQAQQMFRDIAARVEQIREQPEFYNTLTNNCTNNIVNHTNKVALQEVNPFDIRIILPGYSDQLAFEQRLIGDGQTTFEELKSAARIDNIARKVGITETFSTDIRAGHE